MTLRASRVEDNIDIVTKEQRRVVVMGAARVGKTCIISQFLYDKYLVRYRKTVEEFHRGDYNLPDGSSLTLDILDTSGAFEFPAMRKLSMSTAGAFILVFALNDEESWNVVGRLRKEITDIRGYKMPIVIVANKLDVEESEIKVQRQRIEMMVTGEWRCGYVECSAKDYIGILEIFKELLIQADIRYNLSPAVRRRRQSFPSYSTQSAPSKHSLKRHSCVVA